MPIVHIICGPVGAGKTTLARQLAHAEGAVRFSLDEWVMELFGREAPQPLDLDWWVDHCDRCSKRIWSVCTALLARGVDVVLDCGFSGFAQREEYRAFALKVGATVHLHVVDADPPLRRARVQARNREQRETFALHVTDDMFETSEPWWEPPRGAELTGAVTIHTPETA